MLPESEFSYVADGIRTQTLADGRVVYGGYDKVVNTATWGGDSASQNAASRDLIVEQLVGRGLGGSMVFAVDKQTFNFGDGMFWARGEGTDMAQPLLRGFPWNVFGAANDPSTALWGIHVHLAEVLWLSVLTAAGLGLMVGPVRRDVLLAAVTVFGVGLFMLLFQGRARYLIPHLPVFCALAAIGAATIWRRLRPRYGRRVAWPDQPSSEVSD